MVSNLILSWRKVENLHEFRCEQYEKLKIVLKGKDDQGRDMRFWGLYLGGKLLYKYDLSFAMPISEVLDHIDLMRDKAQEWWNVDYRAKRLQIRVKLWTLRHKVNNSELENKENDQRYIESIYVRFSNEQGGLTPNEILGLNAIAEKYSVDDIPNVNITSFDKDIYTVNNEFIVQFVNRNDKKFYQVKKNDEILYETTDLEDAFSHIGTIYAKKKK